MSRITDSLQVDFALGAALNRVMQLRKVERGGVRFVECVEPIAQVSEVLELVAGCIEHDATGVLIESRMLPPEFFDLRSGFAGEFLQKLVNYGLRLAAVFPNEAAYGERFREFLVEAKRGRSFRSFSERADAEAWLRGESA